MDGTPVNDGRTDAPDRQTLSRERIIAAAIAFVDEHGLTALTMRRLGKELGVEAMSLYRYVNGREDLLEGIVDQWCPAAPATRTARARAGRRLAGLPAVAGPRRAGPRPRPPPGLPPDRDAAPRRAVAAAAAAQFAGRRGLPGHARSRAVSATPRGGGIPGVLQLPARATCCSRPACWAPRPVRPRSRSTRATPMSPTRTRSSTWRSSRTSSGWRAAVRRPRRTGVRKSDRRAYGSDGLRYQCPACRSRTRSREVVSRPPGDGAGLGREHGREESRSYLV